MRRPAAHNPMIFRKVARPAGRACAACGGHVRPGLECEGCAFEVALAELEPARVPDPARADIGIEPWE